MSDGDKLPPLNSAQRKAVTFGESVDGGGWRSGPLLIIAGAGTGKTSTLAHRVAHLIASGVDPARIMLLTFTRRAALEMRRRARHILRESQGDSMGDKTESAIRRLSWTGTFHSTANRLLRAYAAPLKLDPAFTVIDRGDSADLMDAIRTEQGLAGKERRFPRKDTCLAIYSWRVNTRMPLKDSLERQFPWCLEWEQDLTRLYREYVSRKQHLSLLDYDDLLLYWHLMMGEQRLAQHLSSNFDHVLVDEYQDTNKLQAEILLAMRPDGAGVTVVGDDAQAIYSFRAAAVENILQFPDQYKPKAEVVTLAQNYRSTQAVLDVSNALMAEAPRQFRKHLLSIRGAGSKPLYVSVDDLAAQAEYVSDQVLRRREAGVSLRSQAVLFRNASASDALEVELLRRRIPFVKYGGLKFLEAAHVKDMLSVLRWVDNPRNSLAGFRVLQLLPGMGPVNARRCIEQLESAQGSVAALMAHEPPQPLRLDYRRLCTLFQTLADPAHPWPGQVRQVRDWYQPHLQRIYEHVHTRVGDLDQLEQLSTQYSSRERFITELTLDPPHASGDLSGTPHLDEDYLVLSTVHSAKGMEWDTVYVIGVNEGSFPSEFSTGRADLLEEERRLLYVAMTRARNELQLCSPLRYSITHQPRSGDGHVYGGRSRFLSDKVLETVSSTSWHSSARDATLDGVDGRSLEVDVKSRLKDMW